MQAAAGAGGAQPGEAIFTDTAGASWVVPAGVTSISAVCIGGGGAGTGNTSGGSGGGGGDLRYYNNLAVTPGETLTIVVGVAGIVDNNTGLITNSGPSKIQRSGTTLLEAAGGGRGTTSGSGAKQGTSTTRAGDVGGYDGGVAGNPPSSTTTGGGGGAGGYSGNGGSGGAGLNAGGNGSGGAAGGGGGGGSVGVGGSGGGVNVFGLGQNGVGGTYAGANGNGGTAGSYGDGALNNTNTGTRDRFFANNFGGGGNGADTGTQGGSGGQGVVRIVWPGDARSFPSTDVWMSQIITTAIETQSSSNTITIPASAQAGDLAVLMATNITVGAQSDPSGWTRIVNQEAASPVLTVWYRIIQSGDASTTVTTTGGSTDSLEMVLLRKATGAISSVTVSGETIQQSTGVPSTQVQSASTATNPFIVFGVYACGIAVLSSFSMYFTGGIAGSGNVEPSYSYSGDSGDSSRIGFMRFRIYDNASTTDVSVVSQDIQDQTMASFIIEVN